jgi:hypothetical protein
MIMIYYNREPTLHIYKSELTAEQIYNLNDDELASFILDNSQIYNGLSFGDFSFRITPSIYTDYIVTIYDLIKDKILMDHDCPAFRSSYWARIFMEDGEESYYAAHLSISQTCDMIRDIAQFQTLKIFE